VTAAGEPLEPALLHAVRDAWDLDLRDGYGQTETTAQIGNPPGRRPVPGGTGHPLPGIPVLLLDPESGREVPDGEPGEICLDLSRRPAGMMRGYTGDPGRTLRAFAGDCYRTGDLAVRSADGLLTYLSRADDMFKSFDHRISPGELERALLGHPAVADAAVVPVADPVGMWLPKAYVVAAPGHAAYGGTARRILEFSRSVLPPEKWVGLLEFTAALPRTTSGKVRRGELKEVRRGTEYAIDGAV
jgi:acetyl-CoA synthetase